MSKIDLETVEFILVKHRVPDHVSVIKDLRQAIQEEADEKAAEKEKQGTPEKPYPVILATQDLPHLSDTPFFLLEPNGDLSTDEVLRRLQGAISDFNRDAAEKKSKARRRKSRKAFTSIETIGEAFERLPRTLLKKVGLKARHKVPCIPIYAPNDLTVSTEHRYQSEDIPSAPIVEGVGEEEESDS